MHPAGTREACVGSYINSKRTSRPMAMAAFCNVAILGPGFMALLDLIVRVDQKRSSRFELNNVEAFIIYKQLEVRLASRR